VSNEAITWAYRDVKGIGLTAKAVLVRLADQANSDGIAWPGKNSLAEVLDCDKRTVDRAIEKLIAMGLISVQREKSEAGKNETNVYCLHMKQPELFERSPAVRVAQRHGWQSATHGTAPGGRVAESHGEGGRAPPEPSLEPSVEPERGRAPRKRGSRLPPDWTPSVDLTTWAAHEFPNVDHVYETEKFTDHWEAATGKGAAKRDWGAAWRNWIRKANEYRSNGTGTRETAVQRSERIERELLERAEAGLRSAAGRA